MKSYKKIVKRADNIKLRDLITGANGMPVRVTGIREVEDSEYPVVLLFVSGRERPIPIVADDFVTTWKE